MMNIKSMLMIAGFSVAALATPAFAQMTEKTLNGEAVSEEDAALVQQFCDSLVNDTESTDTEEIQAEDDGETNLGTAEDVSEIDFDTITLATCQEGGWVE